MTDQITHNSNAAPELVSDSLESTAQTDLQRVKQLADFLDTRYEVFGIKLGWDGIIGLFPIVGDVLTTGLSGYTILLARQHGASKWLLTKMLWNTGIDMTVGAVPFAGDLLDFMWKANTRNLRLLEGHLHKKHQTERKAKASRPKARTTQAKTFVHQEATHSSQQETNKWDR